MQKLKKLIVALLYQTSDLSLRNGIGKHIYDNLVSALCTRDLKEEEILHSIKIAELVTESST